MKSYSISILLFLLLSVSKILAQDTPDVETILKEYNYKDGQFLYFRDSISNIRFTVDFDLRGDNSSTICLERKTRIYVITTEEFEKAESSVYDAAILGELITKLANNNKLKKVSIIINGPALSSTFGRIDFSKLKKLEEIRILNYSEDETIIPQSIYGLNGIKTLRIYNAKLRTISKDIEHLKSLEMLDLENNQLTGLPIEIENLKNLKYLNLSDNQFKEMPHCISKLKKLKHLSMGENKVESLPLDLDKLDNLEYLNLSDFKTVNFLRDYTFPSLDTLILKSTLIDSIPDNISSYRDLKVLDLEYANIVYVSNKINDLQNLKNLNLGYSYVSKQEVEKTILNKINIIHSETTCYDINFAKRYPSHIRSLRLSFKELEELNDNIFGFIELKSIDISNSRRGQVDTNFIETPNLNEVCRRLSHMEGLGSLRYEYFDYYENSLPDLSGIEQLQNIKSLQLTEMRMTEFPVIVCKLSNLETLSLRFNQIEIIPEELSQLVNLKHLDFRKNCIYDFPKSVFELKNLEYLDMVNNNIKEVPSELSEMPKLKKVYLYNIRNRDGYDGSCYNEITIITPEIKQLVKSKILVID